MEHEYGNKQQQLEKIEKNRKINRIRRGGKKHKSKFKTYFTLFGNNTAGLKNKKDSLEANIDIFKKPSCITLQETKLPKYTNFQLGDYQIFQKNRNISGGGLLTAVDPVLNPVLLESRNEEAEILAVQIALKDKNLRIINGYGPQDDDPQQIRLNFWLGLEEEIISAKHENCMVIVQMDANAKVGKDIIENDPNSSADNNGRNLLQLIERQGLKILNSDKKCVGTITRFRETINTTEVSVLDYVLVCEDMYHYFVDMHIDEDRKFTLTKYATTKGKSKLVKSDHNPMICKFNIQYEKRTQRLKRREIFNLKNKECQAMFYETTNNNLKLQYCLNKNGSIEEKSNHFFKTFDDILHKTFSKIRIRVGARRSDVSKLIEAKTNLLLTMAAVNCKLAR